MILQNSSLRLESSLNLKLSEITNISETNEVILNKDKTKGILTIHNSSALIRSSY